MSGRKLASTRRRVVDRICSDWEMICRDVENEFTEVELLLRQDLARNKIRWHGVWLRDLWCFLRNNNPVCSLCFSHYLHPISRKNRLVAMGLQVLFLLFIAAALAEARLCEACNFTQCETRPSPKECVITSHDGNKTQSWHLRADPENMSEFAGLFTWDTLVKFRKQKRFNMVVDPSLNFCCLCKHVFAIWFFEAFGRQGGFIYVVLANCAFALTVFPLLMCACVQRCSPRCRKLGEVIGYLIIASAATVMLLWTPFLIRYVQRNHMLWDFTANLIVGKIGSWSFVTLINVIFFSCAWHLQGGAVPSDPTPREGGNNAGAAAEAVSGCCSSSSRLARKSSKSSPTLPSIRSGQILASRSFRPTYHVTAEEYVAYASRVAQASVDDAQTGEGGDAINVEEAASHRVAAV